MATPQMPNIPGAAVMTDTLDFVKNLWGSMNVPGMSIPGITAPTLSIEELDKKISDLKAVESWLNLNTSMLRGSIQALEVQRGTIVTLKSMGASLAAAIQQPGASEKNLFESSPYASAFFQHAQAPQAQPEPAAPPPAPEPQAAQPTPPLQDSAAAQLANPNVWWNLLQDQFKQAVSTAMASDPVSSTAAGALAGADKTPAPARAPAAKKTPAASKAPAKRAAAVKPKTSRAAKS